MAKKETVQSRFDRDSLQAGEISLRIEAGDIAGDLDPADSIGFDIAKTSREKPHQLLVFGANSLRLTVVRITRSGMARKEFIDRADLHPRLRQRAHDAREFRTARRRASAAERK